MPESGEYCRAVETYLCRRNGGHLIRIVGPAFERVCGWAETGVPLRIVEEGIDRKLARQEAAGGRRRPVRIEHCEADVLAVFDEWRRAVGVRGGAEVVPDRAASGGVGDGATEARRSLPKHIERAQMRAANLLARPEPVAGLHAALESTLRDLAALGDGRQARAAARTALVARLQEIDHQLLETVRDLAGDLLPEVEREAAAELAAFRERMAKPDHARAVRAGVDRALRRRLRLPVIEFSVR